MTGQRIGVTQRVSVVEEYGERRDCLDQQWTVLLQELGYVPIPLPNRTSDVSEYVDNVSLDGVILSSGNDLSHFEDASVSAPERDEFERGVLECVMDRGIPLLGVCRGLELLVHYFGGRLVNVEGHVAQEHGLQIDAEAAETVSIEAFSGDITVNSYHDYGIQPEVVSDELRTLASAPDGTVELVEHRSHPIVGMMWHPERDSPAADLDRQILTQLFGNREQ